MPPKKNIITLLKNKEYGDKSSRNELKERYIDLLSQEFNRTFPSQIAIRPPIQTNGGLRQNVAPIIIPEPQGVIEIPPPSPPQIDRRNVGGRKTIDGRGGRGGRN
jgi:hypothetical protein